MDISTSSPFYIFVSTFYHRKARLPKYMTIETTAVPPNVIYTIDSTDQNVLPVGPRR